MIGNLVQNIKSRWTNRVGDESFSGFNLPNRSTSKSRNLFVKLLNSSYALVSQNGHDDAYCSENLFMLPRVYSQTSSGHDNELWSPISLKPCEKSLDELDNIVDKFVRCINMENCGENVKKNLREKTFFILTPVKWF